MATSCIFGTVLYSIERTSNPDSTRLFPNVAIGIYYTILAMTNVGLDGFLPSTYLGKWIACAAVTLGLFTSRMRSTDHLHSMYRLVALPLPLILVPYTRYWIKREKNIVYRLESVKD
jgi:hypothetical protein